LHILFYLLIINLNQIIMKKLTFLLICVAGLFLASCNSYRHSMREPNARVEYHAEDFTLSDQVSGEATVTRILCVDWEHLFGGTKIGSTSVIGDIVPSGANYALYEMMQKAKGYDVVIYPQVEVHRNAPILGTDLYSKTTYKVTARMGKLKK
jgi:hypothetical protein